MDHLSDQEERDSKRKVIRLKNLFTSAKHPVQDDAYSESPPPSAPPPLYDDVLTQYRQQAEAEISTLHQNSVTELDALRQTRLTEIESEVQNQLDQGYKSGYEKGYEEGKNKLSSLAQDVLATLNSVVEEKHQLLRQAGKAVLNLGFSIAEKIIQTQLKQDASIFKNILEEALAKVTQKDRVLIKVNKSDFESIKAYRPHLEKTFNDIKQLDIVPDPDIEVGGCIIETKLGYVDSSISTKKELIQNAFMQLYDEIDNPITAPISDESLIETEPDTLPDASIDEPIDETIDEPIDETIDGDNNDTEVVTDEPETGDLDLDFDDYEDDTSTPTDAGVHETLPTLDDPDTTADSTFE
tara:strand:- start:1124 stop:2185 length:1062 start_codon:yes stop_codon:yes gene_type:complete